MSHDAVPRLRSSLAGVAACHQRAIEPDGVRHAVQAIPYDEGEDIEPWHQDWYEYLVDHPWLLLNRDTSRTFHICTEHPHAQLREGAFSKDFRCPNATPSCVWARWVATLGALRLAPPRAHHGGRQDPPSVGPRSTASSMR